MSDDGFYCDICDMNFSSSVLYRNHVSGLTHSQNALKGGPEPPGPPSNSRPPPPQKRKISGIDKGDIKCDVCEEYFEDDMALAKHFVGIHHQTKVASKRPASESADDAESPRKRANSETSHKSTDRNGGGQLPSVELDRDAFPMSFSSTKKGFLEEEEGTKKKRSTSFPMKCEVCQITMEITAYDKHLEGKPHQRNLKRQRVGVSPKDLKHAQGGIALITEAIEKCKQPIVGLQYVTEFQFPSSGGDPRYLCYLCDAKCNVNTFLPHVLGRTHKQKYMKEHYYRQYEGIEWTASKSNVQAQIENLTAEIERREGRFAVKVNTDGDDSFEGKGVQVPDMPIQDPLDQFRKHLSKGRDAAKEETSKIRGKGEDTEFIMPSRGRGRGAAVGGRGGPGRFGDPGMAGPGRGGFNDRRHGMGFRDEPFRPQGRDRPGQGMDNRFGPPGMFGGPGPGSDYPNFDRYGPDPYQRDSYGPGAYDREPVRPREPEPEKLTLTQLLKKIIKKMDDEAITEETEARLALQASNQLSDALMKYRIRKMPMLASKLTAEEKPKPASPAPAAPVQTPVVTPAVVPAVQQTQADPYGTQQGAAAYAPQGLPFRQPQSTPTPQTGYATSQPLYSAANTYDYQMQVTSSAAAQPAFPPQVSAEPEPPMDSVPPWERSPDSTPQVSSDMDLRTSSSSRAEVSRYGSSSGYDSYGNAASYSQSSSASVPASTAAPLTSTAAAPVTIDFNALKSILQQQEQAVRKSIEESRRRAKGMATKKDMRAGLDEQRQVIEALQSGALGDFQPPPPPGN